MIYYTIHEFLETTKECGCVERYWEEINSSFSLEEIQRYFQKMKAEKRNARVECVEVIMEYDDDTEYEYVA
jgi:hypothetical protein